MDCLKFSDPYHVDLIKLGEKRQTTRRPTTLKKCDKVTCVHDNEIIGIATVTDIIRCRGNLVFQKLRDTTKESWAKRDGFSSFNEADVFMAEIYGDGWQSLDMDVIYFKGDWVQEA